MESITYLRNIKMTPKKLRFFMPVIKRMSPAKALIVLAYTPNKTAKIFYKAIKSAMSNAKQTLKVSDDLLQFKLLSVDEGQVLKRFNSGSRGSAKPYKKRFSHIKIVLHAASQTVSPSLPKEKPVEKIQDAEVVIEEKKALPTKKAVKKVVKK